MTSSLQPHQQLGTPVTLPFANFFELLKSHVDRDPGHSFALFPESGTEYSYWQFYRLALSAADWLTVVTPGQKYIAVVLRNTPEFLAIYFGALFLGITVVPINPDLASREISFIIENSTSTTVFYDPAFKTKVAEVEGMTPAAKFISFE